MFNYITFKKGLASLDKKKCNILKKHIKLYGDSPYIEQEVFHIEYLSKFKPINYSTPHSLEEEFEWPLLLRITAASFSSNYDFVFRDNDLIPKLVITVGNQNETVSKSIDCLIYSQINRLFQIYIEECINLQGLAAESEFECKAIEFERNQRISLYEKKVNNVNMILNYRTSNVESELLLKNLLAKYTLK